MSVVNVIIPGAPKAGTLSITSILNQHTDVYVPAWKEPRFFIEDKIKELGDNTPLKKYLMRSSVLEWSKYKTLYNNESRFKIDASVQYLYYYKSAVPKIKKYLGDPYIFIILRDPVQRAVSNYLENFSKVKVLFYEDFQSDNLRFVNSILDDLGLSRLETIQELPKLNTSSELTFKGKI